MGRKKRLKKFKINKQPIRTLKAEGSKQKVSSGYDNVNRIVLDYRIQ